MAELSKLEQGIALIREAFAEAHETAKAEIIAQIAGTAKPTTLDLVTRKRPRPPERKRAPKGAAKRLVHRILAAHPGSNFAAIMRARTEVEKQVSESSVRKEIGRGLHSFPKEYLSDKGHYSLASLT